LAETAFALHGRLDIAINNVGGPQKPGGLANRMHECNLADWLGSFDKTLHSVFLGMRHQIPLMLQTGGGAIVNISSMAGVRYTESAGAAYGVAKGAVVRLTEFAAVSYAKDKIRINVVAPGVTATEAVMRVYPDEAERNAKAAKDHPMGRLMAPEEIADACLWACSDAASGVTGLMIPVAGGWAAK
jgi:NAD(P)-dependent dehydrogenase (short-subunit alcohol dehydrogenase family)